MMKILYTYIEKRNHDFLIHHELPGFPKDFKSKVLKYRRWQDMQLSILGRLLLKHGLKNTYFNKFSDETKLCYTAYNKPYFKNQSVKFNISHSGDIVVCAIAPNFEIGIDIEMLQDVKINDFRDQMTLYERQHIESSFNIKNAFFDYWTQKEAVIKANGMGLSIPLQSFEVRNNHTRINEEDFYLKEILIDQKYKCHVACKNRLDSLKLNPQRIDVFALTGKILENNLIAHDYL